LGENTINDIQELSDSLPKPLSSFSAILQKPDVIVDPGDLPATARELRDLFAASGRYFDRQLPAGGTGARPEAGSKSRGAAVSWRIVCYRLGVTAREWIGGRTWIQNQRSAFSRPKLSLTRGCPQQPSQ
jgi:hypothetical protein